MPEAKRKVVSPLNPGEAKILKASIFDLNETAAKQCLYGIIQVLSFKNSLSISFFKEILDDSVKYCQVKKGVGQ
ncbi:MAG: hypothetical protein FJ110_05585 [Deltaproteobacteria bacterium]|nr:hypothetical protein [Deltaproteobacteria bacterium]